MPTRAFTLSPAPPVQSDAGRWQHIEMIKKNLELISPDGARKQFSIEIGIPFEDDRCWCCPVNLPGLHELNKGICGEDSIQSLCLALGFVKKLLESEIERGLEIHEAGSESEWPIDLMLKI